MADSLLSIAEIVERIISKVNEISALPKECSKLREVVIKLKPVYDMFSNQLQSPAQRDVMEMLFNALRKAEHVVDFINEHPEFPLQIKKVSRNSYIFGRESRLQVVHTLKTGNYVRVLYYLIL